MKYRYEDLAKMIDHALLHPTLTDAQLEAGCQTAIQYQVASVCVKPYHVSRAAKLLAGSDVAVGTVIGFPHGGNRTEVKRLETELACRDGAVEIDMVLNIGKAISGDWDYVFQDIQAVSQETHQHGGKLKVILETDYLTGGGGGLDSDSLKTKLCQICEAAEADWVKTSTGFGFVKQAEGGYNYQGATEHDLKLMRTACSAKVQVKASGGVRDLAGLIRVRELGASRCGTSATEAILDAYHTHANGETASAPDSQLGQGGY
ncbi:deoxyribose-phosphate aldolase [Blastopirellula marina]|uniref:Deoxyribose-phosphate aldolase n=1 Tax=Blastopirellula marina TaxID=124 RepID=A0A2S8F818_9BACT|nr:deoxyribose-phosphate aldolase [Blastopirellula marina]PQO28295.1 deoxyribose-phosphate aldolase [Blastopirellula marina]PTL41835.1 deoxyribose-phosphate aldolase [Blastopirellula marina]